MGNEHQQRDKNRPPLIEGAATTRGSSTRRAGMVTATKATASGGALTIERSRPQPPETDSRTRSALRPRSSRATMSKISVASERRGLESRRESGGLLAMACSAAACARFKPPPQNPPRIIDSPPEQTGRARTRRRGLGLPAEEQRWGRSRRQKELKRQAAEKAEAAAEEDVVIPMPAPQTAGRPSVDRRRCRQTD